MAPEDSGAGELALRPLRHGYAVSVEDGGSNDVLALRSEDGRIVLRIALTPQGPLLEVQSPSLTLSTSGTLRVDCERFEVNARQEVAIRGGQEVSVQSDQALRLDGDIVRINSPDE
jgi:hypothetical protein